MPAAHPTLVFERLFYHGGVGQRRKEAEWPRQRIRHVWVQTPQHHHPPAPGLLICWRHHENAWWGWVVTVVGDHDDLPTVAQHWYHSRDIIAAPTEPMSPDPHRWHLGLYADEHAST